MYENKEEMVPKITIFDHDTKQNFLLLKTELTSCSKRFKKISDSDCFHYTITYSTLTKVSIRMGLFIGVIGLIHQRI